MNFLIADTFTDSLARLSRDEQKAIKTTAFDLQVNPSNPGMQFHRIDRAKDRNFWSVRVSSNIRLIVHKSESSMLLCYVDHHDKAYAWAERRKLEVHPNSGAAQFVEIVTRFEEVIVPKYEVIDSQIPHRTKLFENTDDFVLLSLGVPADWLERVRSATEETILGILEHLPAEAAECLLDVATGGIPSKLTDLAGVKEAALAVREPAVEYEEATKSPFDHPDAKRRFRLVNTPEELERALEYPWDKWTIFLHPAQRASVEANYSGPARISGSAGTGKTVVALHRAVFLAKSDTSARVLLTTFSEVLANSLRRMLRRLIGNEPRLAERIEVHAINSIAHRLYELNIARPNLASCIHIAELLAKSASANGGQKFTGPFLLSEWEQVVDAWQLDSWEGYRDVARLGRKTRLPEKQREILWKIFSSVRGELLSLGLTTEASLLSRLAVHNSTMQKHPFDFVVVDESQDVSVAQLRFLSSLASGRPNGLFFTGDLGQRIFQQPFSWKSLGVDIRGRSKTLRVNYRTSHQIRRQADRLLGPEVTDVDENVEVRKGTISVFNGPSPIVRLCKSESEEITIVREWLSARTQEGILSHELGVFVRSEAQLDRATSAVSDAGLSSIRLDENIETKTGFVSVGTMHLAKGLEFRAVAVMACDEDVLPLQSRIEEVGDAADLQDIYDTERHLLYVACTRARDNLIVTGVEPGSEFLGDLSDSRSRKTS